jgi:protein-disulfide isomerase
MWLLAFSVLASVTPTPAAEVAARVDEMAILIREIDAPSQAKLDKLHAQLRELVAETVGRLIDDRVCAGASESESPTPVPITDDAIRAFQEAHRQDFESPVAPEAAAPNSALTRKAIRHLLERQARDAAAAAACRRRRQTHAIEHLPAAAGTLAAPLPPTQALARIDATPLPAGDVERAAALRLYRLRGEIFRERQRNLSAAVDEALLAREAARRNTSRAALDAELAAPQPVTEAELDAFLDGERAKGRPVPARDRARPYLEFQQAHARRAMVLDNLRAAARIEVLLSEPVVPLLPVEEQGAAAVGPAAGPRVVAYSNYRCRPCRATHRELDRLRRIDPTVRVVFRDFVPVYDPVASEAARLARCAAALGVFPAMREILLTRDPPPFGRPWYGDETLPELARTIGADPRRFAACAADPTQLAHIESDTEDARALGFDEAPAFVAEGVPLSGMQSAEGLARALQEGIARRP